MKLKDGEVVGLLALSSLRLMSDRLVEEATSKLGSSE